VKKKKEEERRRKKKKKNSKAIGTVCEILSVQVM